LERGVGAPEAVREDLKPRLSSCGANLLDSRELPRFAAILEMAKDAPPFTFANIENLAVSGFTYT